MKKIFRLLLILSLFLIPNVNAINSTYDKITDTSLKIYDYGKYLNEDEKRELKVLIDDYIEKHKMDMVIVTKKDYNYYRMQDYAQDFYDYNGFGTDNIKSGILLFYNVDSEGPAIWISTTGNAILVYDDNRINTMKSHMSSVKYKGTKAILESFISDASDYALKGVPESNKYAYIDEEGNYKIDYDKKKADEEKALSNQRKQNFISSVSSCILISIIISSIYVFILVKKNKTIKKESTASFYLDRSSINIYNFVDKFIGTNTSTRYIGSDDSSSSGSSGGSSSSGGGSSISIGSSGTSHGGGGGRL